MKNKVCISVLLLIAVGIGCTEDTTYRTAFEEYFASDGRVIPNVQYNGNEKAISVYYEDDDHETFFVLEEEVLEEGDTSEIKFGEDTEETFNTLFSKAKYDTKFIPAEFSAKTPEDVKYAIIIIKYNSYFGRYEGGAEAWQINYKLQIVELHPAFRHLFVYSIDGSNPPRSIQKMRGTTKVYGSPPKRVEVVDKVRDVLIYLRDNFWDDTQEEYKANEQSIADSIEDENNEPIFEIVESMPQFPGGEQSMMEYIKNNIIYPANAKDRGIQGRVFVQFVVEADGSISGVQVLRGIEELNDEAIRVIKTMPRWLPGKQRGDAVRVRNSVPVQFRLNE